MNGGRTSRPIEKLYQLEVRVGAPDDSEVITVPATPSEPKAGVTKPESTKKRPTRQATIAARKQLYFSLSLFLSVHIFLYFSFLIRSFLFHLLIFQFFAGTGFCPDLFGEMDQ